MRAHWSENYPLLADGMSPSASIARLMIANCLALTASFASQRKTVLFAGMALSRHTELRDSPGAMRSQILSSIARVRMEGRPGRRFLAGMVLLCTTFWFQARLKMREKDAVRRIVARLN